MNFHAGTLVRFRIFKTLSKLEFPPLTTTKICPKLDFFKKVAICRALQKRSNEPSRVVSSHVVT